MHTRRVRQVAGIYTPQAYGSMPAAVVDPYVAMFGQSPQAAAGAVASGMHPLSDAGHNRRLLNREAEITSAFDSIEPALGEVARMQHQDGAADRIQDLVRSRLGFELPASP